MKKGVFRINYKTVEGTVEQWLNCRERSSEATPITGASTKKPYKTHYMHDQDGMLEIDVVLSFHSLRLLARSVAVYPTDIPATLSSLPGNHLKKGVIRMSTVQVYPSLKFSVFPMHKEDFGIPSLHWLIRGGPKIWHIIPPKFMEKFETFVKQSK